MLLSASKNNYKCSLCFLPRVSRACWRVSLTKETWRSTTRSSWSGSTGLARRVVASSWPSALRPAGGLPAGRPTPAWCTATCCACPLGAASTRKGDFVERLLCSRQRESLKKDAVVHTELQLWRERMAPNYFMRKYCVNPVYASTITRTHVFPVHLGPR